MKAYYNIYLTIDDVRVWMNKYTSKMSFTFAENLCSTAWKSAVDTASCKLVFNDRNVAELSDIVSKIVEAQQSFPQKEIQFEALNADESKIVFRGYLDLGKLSIESSKIPGSISITAKSPIDKLGKKPKANFVLYPATVKDVVERCVAEAGLGLIVEWKASISGKQLEVPFVVTDEDSDTWRDKIDTLLMEMGGCTLSFDHNGNKFYISKVNDESKAFSDIPVNYHVQSKLKSTTTKFAKDGVVVSYGNLKISKDQIVYYHDTNLKDKDSFLKGDEIAPGVYYPFDSDITKTFEEYQASNLDYGTLIGNTRKANNHINLFYVDPASTKVTIIASDMNGKGVSDWYSNETFISKEGGFTYPGGGAFYPRKAWLSFKNNTENSVNITQFSISGDTYYSDTEYRIVMPLDCEDPEEYSAKYIADTETAKTLASFLMNQKRFGSDTSTWTERWENHSLGDKVKIQHKSGNIINAVIVKKESIIYGDELWAKITAVSLDGWSYEQPALVQNNTQSPSLLDPYENAKRNGYVGSREQWENRNDIFYLWSSSEKELKPKKRAYWKLGGKWMLFKNLPVGDFGMQDWMKSWAEVMADRTEEYNYLWAKVGLDGESFLLQGVSPMDFSVLVTPPSYTVNPRRKDAFTLTAKITRLNGIKGVSSLVLDGTSYSGITIAKTNNDDEWIISIAQLTTTSLSFSLKALVGGVEKKITLAGTMIDYSSKYMGAVDSLPSTDEEGNKLLEGDWCVLKSDNLMYVYKSNAWVSVTDSQVNSFVELEKMSTALVDMIAIGSTQSATATILGVFKMLCADNGFIKFLKTWALFCGAGDETSGFYCRIADHDPTTGQVLTKPLFIVKYNGNTVFQIDPSSGNVFFGKPNSALSAPESGFMYDAANQSIVSANEKVRILSSGEIIADSATIINADISGRLNGASGYFSGNFDTPSISSLPNTSGGTTYTDNIPARTSNTDASQINALVSFKNKIGEYNICSLSCNSEIKTFSATYSKGGGYDLYNFYFYDANGNQIYSSTMSLAPGPVRRYYGNLPATTISATVGAGDILKFKDIQIGSAGLVSGQIYRNSSNQLFIVP